MNWNEFITKLKGHLLVLQDTTASKYIRFKAGLAILALIGEILPDSLLFGDANGMTLETTGGIDGCLAAIEQQLPKSVGVGAAPVTKIGDGVLLKLFMELAKQLLPIILPLLV